MRVWQPGTHLSSVKKVEVDDWSWRRTRRRIAELARLTKPYKTRTALSVVSLLAATATALAPPLLAKYAVDDGIRKHDLGKLWWIVGAFIVACSVYADLALLVTDPADYQFFPPFKRGYNANMNRVLGGETYEIAKALLAGEGFAHPFKERTGPTAWTAPLVSC